MKVYKQIRICIDKLNEPQMQKVREFLAQMPNKPHQDEDNKKIYGSYIEVSANVRGTVDTYTAQNNLQYENVVFQTREGNNEQVDSTKRKEERKKVWEGLESLIAGLEKEE